MTPTTELPAVRRRRRRARQASIRLRVLGFTAVLLIGASGVAMAVQRTVQLRRVERQANARLDEEHAELARVAAGTDPRTGRPFGDDAAAVFDTFLARNIPHENGAFYAYVDGRPYQRTRETDDAPVRLDLRTDLTRRWASLAHGERGELATSAGPIRYLAVPLQRGGSTRGVFVAVHYLRAERDEVNAFLRVQALVVGLVIAVAIGVAWLVAGRLLRPLRDVTATARAIGESDLSRRIPVDRDDEVGQLARTFNEMLDRLEVAFAAQRAFVDDAGHELRTPITVVMGQLELMGDDPDDRAKTMAVVDDELQRMARIVEDLLVLAKAEQPDFVRPEPVELNDFTTELLMKARTLGDRGWRLEACASGSVELDRQRITQAVLNLARNAVEHTEPGTVVTMGSRWAGGVVRLWVHDEGPGIDPAEQRRVFERFTRGRGARRRSDGAGLGLAKVAAVAEAHGGRVELDSATGAGSCFTIVVPATAVTPPDDDEGAAARSPGSVASTDEPSAPSATEVAPNPRGARWPAS